jgi:phosphate starvation-inducible PhoH-like protein
MVFEDNRLVPALYGEQNAHLRKIEQALQIEIGDRGNELVIMGRPREAKQARSVLDALWARLRKGDSVDGGDVDAALRFLSEGTRLDRRSGSNNHDIESFSANEVSIATRKRRVNARTPLQSDYIKAMKSNQLVFGIGPAGTGKTYLAVAHAVEMMEAGKVERIILSRPAIEAGERLGFLPGEMKEKMDPYMRPLYDALHDTLATDRLQKKIIGEEIEIAPLAFMRGRTLNNACIILDEAQNATAMQMLMFLTRAGENSHVVITGDPSQIDLPAGSKSGLLDAVETLQGVEDIAIIKFTQHDVVRSRLVKNIIAAYNKKSGA